MQIRVTCTALSSTSATLTAPEGLSLSINFVVAQAFLGLAVGNDYLVLIDANRPPRSFNSQTCRSLSNLVTEPLAGDAIQSLVACASISNNTVFTLQESASIEPTISFIFTFPQPLSYHPWTVNQTYTFQLQGLTGGSTGFVSPGVWGTSPGDNDTSIGITATPIITFNTPAIDPATVLSTNILIKKGSDNSTVTQAGNPSLDITGRVTITPNSNLSLNTLYYLVVTSSVKDTSGRSCVAYTQIATPWRTVTS